MYTSYRHLISNTSSARHAWLRSGLLACLLAATSACTNTIKYDEKSRAPELAAVNVDTQLDSAVKDLTVSMVNSPAVMSYTFARRPSIALDPLADRSGARLDMNHLADIIKGTVIEQDSYTIITDRVLAEHKAKLKLDADSLENPRNAQALANAAKSDLIMTGSITQIIVTESSRKQTVYRLTMQVVDRKDGMKLWHAERDAVKSEKKAVFGI